MIMTFTAFMVIGRVVSGVHWITDIIGATLFSAGLVMIYQALAKEDSFEKRQAERLPFLLLYTEYIG